MFKSFISNPPRVRIFVFTALWVLITVGFALFRSSTGFINDDTIRLYSNLYHLNPSFEKWRGWETVCFAFKYSLATYPLRQLSGILSHLAIPFCHETRVPLGVSLLAGAALASLAVSFFFVARRFVRSDAWAAFAVFLALCSAPVVSASWVVCTGLQSLVPLMICLGLLSYWRALEAKRHRWIYYVCLFLIMFFGHWFREFVGLLPLLVIFLEIQRARRPTWIMGLCAVCFAHAVFPSALTSFIFPNHPPLTPVYKLSGPLSQVMRGAENPFLSMLREVFNPLMIKKVCVNFLSLFPPVLWILAVFALALRLTLRKGRFAGSVCSPGQWLLLAVWFLLFFLPFFKVYREQVHLAYPVVPMSVVFAALMRDMTDMLRTFKISSPRWIFAALLALVIGDHALNVYGSFMVVNGMNNGITRVADWIKNNTAPRSIFVCNSGGQGMEILFHSGNYFEPCWQDPLVYPSRNAARASTEEGMARMIDEEKGRRKIYLLDSSYDIRGMSVCFCHKYLRGFNFRVKKLGRVHTTRVFYPFLDPLKHFVPYEYISFLSSPDLQTEFYTGPAQDGSLFLREFHVNYDIYEVLGVPLETKITASSMLQPELGPGFLLKGTDPTWHAAAPVVFPQTLTFEFPRAKPVSLVAFHPQGEPSWPEPHYSAMIGRSPKRVGVETSDDGAVWREICVIDPACSFLGWNYHTLPAPVTAKFIRLKIYSSVRDGLTLKGVKFTD